ncbi:MAG: FG-GAP-like repeat-containing protein [Candidatus Bathyarchaeota archaeon]|nr:FG-GAP-like repeat-containing protein [Candidatus Bathyarchaeota archaeon]
MKNKSLIATFLLAFLLLVVFSLALREYSQPNALIMEVEQHWDTYCVGGTCIPGTHNIAVADADGDEQDEIITGGLAYSIINETRTSLGAPLRIWNWNGQNLTLEKSENWPGNIGCIYAGDADGDGETEILTAGGLINNTSTAFSLRIWNWNGQNLTLRGNYPEVYANAIFVADVDNDNKPEILTVGRAYNTSQPNAQLSVWQWNGNSLSLKAKAEWTAPNDIARANSVNAADLDNDGTVEIATCGYINSPKNSSGQLRVWQLNDAELSLRCSAEWRKADGYALDVAGNVMGNTMAYNIKISDVDDDGFAEIITGGVTYNGDKIEGQLRIWNWTGNNLNLETSREWTNLDLTELKAISINDVDADGKKEIVTSGVTTKYGHWTNETNKEKAELKVWNWNENTLTLKQSTEWIVGEGVCAWNVATGNLTGDGKMRIVTVGCMYVATLCDPDMRIWTITNNASTELVIAAGAIVALIALASIYILVKRFRG